MGKANIYLIFFTFFAHSYVSGSQDRDFGLGGSTSGRASSITAETDNPYAAIFNPAVIAAQEAPSFGFSTGASGASYGSLGAVKVDSRDYRTDRGSDRVQEYRLPEQQLTVWSAGITYPFYLPFVFSRRAGIGFTASGPYNRLRSISAPTPYDFSTLRYGTSDAQFKGTLSGSIELWPEHFFFGAGLSLFLTSGGAADTTLVANNPTGRLALDVGLNTAALGGFYGQWGETRAGLVLRQEINPTFDQEFKGKVQLGGEETFNQPFLMHTTMFFEPASVELDLQHGFGWFKGSVGVAYQWWDAYQPSYLIVTTQDADGQSRTTEVPPLALRNTLNPRASLELPTFNDRLTFSAGYQYRPTPLTDVSGATNLLDADTHVAGLSIRHSLKESEWFPLPLTWGLYGQYHWLRSRNVEKSDTRFIGSPGYVFSGNAYAYGFTLHAEL